MKIGIHADYEIRIIYEIQKNIIDVFSHVSNLSLLSWCLIRLCNTIPSIVRVTLYSLLRNPPRAAPYSGAVKLGGATFQIDEIFTYYGMARHAKCSGQHDDVNSEVVHAAVLVRGQPTISIEKNGSSHTTIYCVKYWCGSNLLL